MQCICMYVFMDGCLYVCMFVCLYVCVWICFCLCVCVYVYVCACVRANGCMLKMVALDYKYITVGRCVLCLFVFCSFFSYFLFFVWFLFIYFSLMMASQPDFFRCPCLVVSGERRHNQILLKWNIRRGVGGWVYHRHLTSEVID